MLKKLINTGVHPELSFKDQSKIRIFNSSLLTVAGILIFYTVLGALQGLYFSTALTIVELIFMAFNFWLIRMRKYNLSYHFGILNGMMFLFGFVFILGEDNQAHMYFLFMPMAAMIVFDNKKTVLFYFILSMALLVAANIMFKYIKPYYSVDLTIFGLPNLVFTGLLIFLGIKLFKAENLEFNEKINHQKLLLEQKNKDITDSIHYAKRIQRALLASDSMMKNNLPSHFVLYKPKDIVSGDFYWAEKTESGFMIAACDCTGHGVPGAFMSLLGVTFLNEIVRDKKITRPDLVLNQLRENIITAMNPEGTAEEGKDGMDAILCHFNFTSREMQFACANNPLWILSSENKLAEYKPDNFPIGKHNETSLPFSLQTVTLEKGDTIILSTDGYADQFGGPKGKKFMHRQLKDTLLEFGKLTMNDQKIQLEKIFESWKGELEQVDDVLVIGIKA